MKHGNRISSEYDVVIVGAGPAGCTAAKLLGKDYNVLLIDWSRIPRDKPCGGLLVEEVQKIITNFSLPKNIFSSPKEVSLKLIDWENNLEVKRKRKLLNISRISFDYWLLKLAEKEVDFSPETKFIDFEEKKDRLHILIEKNNKKKIIKTRYLIGADGAISIIRRIIRKKPISYYFAVQEFIKSDKNIGNNTIFIYDNNITDFYSWVIPKGMSLVIGSALKKNNIEGKFRLFKSELKNRLDIDGHVSKKEIAIINRIISKNDIFLGRGNILLVGEAAGLISPSSGEGVSFAIRSGLNCADAIKKSSTNALRRYKDLSKPLIKEIEEKIRKAEILSNPAKRQSLFKEF